MCAVLRNRSLIAAVTYRVLIVRGFEKSLRGALCFGTIYLFPSLCSLHFTLLDLLITSRDLDLAYCRALYPAYCILHSWIRSEASARIKATRRSSTTLVRALVNCFVLYLVQYCIVLYQCMFLLRKVLVPRAHGPVLSLYIILNTSPPRHNAFNTLKNPRVQGLLYAALSVN